MEAAAPIPNTEQQIALSPWQIFWQRLKRRRIAMVGGAVLIVLYLVALFAGFVAPYHYERMGRDRYFHPPIWPKLSGLRLVVPRYEQLPGDFVYREVPNDTQPVHFFIHGDKYQLFSQISLSIGVVGIFLSFTFGLIIGGVSGYFAGATDTVIMRFCELIMSIPALYLIISLRATFPPDMSSSQIYAMIIIILSCIGWAGMARVIRGMTLSLREQQFVLAARALGQSHLKIIVRHILPNTLSYVIVAATLSVPYYILGEVVLSFLGVGIQEPQASWGNMLTAAEDVEYLRNYPWLLAPSAAIFITVLAFNFLGDGLRDAADTKSL